MSSKTDLVNGCQSQSHEGQGDQGLPNVVVDLTAESDPDIPPPQTPSKNVTADARKILGIVAIDLAFVFVVSAGFFFNSTDCICSFAKNYQWISVIALMTWAIILLIYACWRLLFGGGGSDPLLSPGNLLIFALTTLCLTLICVLLTVCSYGLILLFALGSTLIVLLLVLGVLLLTPLNTSGWGNQLMLLAIVFFLTAVFMLITSELIPVSIEVRNRSFIIILCVAVILTFIYTLHYIQTNFVKLDKDDGWLWLHPCIMLLWILNLFVMLFLLWGLTLHMRK